MRAGQSICQSRHSSIFTQSGESTTLTMGQSKQYKELKNEQLMMIKFFSLRLHLPALGKSLGLGPVPSASKASGSCFRLKRLRRKQKACTGGRPQLLLEDLRHDDAPPAL